MCHIHKSSSSQCSQWKVALGAEAAAHPRLRQSRRPGWRQKLAVWQRPAPEQTPKPLNPNCHLSKNLKEIQLDAVPKTVLSSYFVKHFYCLYVCISNTFRVLWFSFCVFRRWHGTTRPALPAPSERFTSFHFACIQTGKRQNIREQSLLVPFESRCPKDTVQNNTIAKKICRSVSMSFLSRISISVSMSPAGSSAGSYTAACAANKPFPCHSVALDAHAARFCTEPPFPIFLRQGEVLDKQSE